jgi:hypothetical protein
VNGIESDNRNTNLVICQDQCYHLLLHLRAKALKECGNADYRRCIYCRKWDSTDHMRKNQSNYMHSKCSGDARRKARHKYSLSSKIV